MLRMFNMLGNDRKDFFCKRKIQRYFFFSRDEVSGARISVANILLGIDRLTLCVDFFIKQISHCNPFVYSRLVVYYNVKVYWKFL